MQALAALKQEGKIRAVGVSNFSRKEIQEAEEIGVVDSYQPPYSLFWRQMEETAIVYCREKGITVLAYSPMAQGILTGKFGPEPKLEKGDHRAKNILFQPEHFRRIQSALDALRPIAERNELTLGQLALAWVVSQTGTCAIAGARNAAQAVQNARAGGVTLSQEELAEIDRIGRTVTDHLGDDPVMWKW
jgi:aryl-alcohol dehydrogenase-like predicted oxidoreductase